MTNKPRPGSRPYALANMAPGSSLLFEAPKGMVVKRMGQIGVDASRVGVSITMSHFLAIQPNTREVIEVIRVTRDNKP